jgi:hypothetical protein
MQSMTPVQRCVKYVPRQNPSNQTSAKLSDRLRAFPMDLEGANEFVLRPRKDKTDLIPRMLFESRQKP